VLSLFVLFACGTGDISVVAPRPADDDGDGYVVDEDCDDHNADAWPGAPEIADDGIDQDCDGLDALTVFGHRDDTDSTALTPDFLIGNVISTDNALTVTHLGFTARWPKGEVKLALYSSDGGFPADLVAETGAAVATEGVNEVALTAPVTIEDGDWWVQIVSSEYIEIAAGEDERIVYRESLWSDPLPDPYGPGSDYTGARISLFVMGDLPD